MMVNYPFKKFFQHEQYREDTLKESSFPEVEEVKNQHVSQEYREDKEYL